MVRVAWAARVQLPDDDGNKQRDLPEGSFRFTTEFTILCGFWLANRTLSIRCVTGREEYPQVPTREAALIFAGDKGWAAKVQLVFW